MDVKDILYGAYKETDTNQTIAANNVGMSCKQLSDRITRDTLKACTFLNILDSIGIDVQFIVKDTGFPVRVKSGKAGKHVVQMIHGVTYDTQKSFPLWSDIRADGTETTLYQLKDRSGYFLVDSSLYGGDCITIVAPLSVNGAIDFLKEHDADDGTIAAVIRGRA